MQIKIDKYVDKQIDIQVYKQIDKQVDKKIDKQVYKHIDMYELNVQIDEIKNNIQIDGKIDTT